MSLSASKLPLLPYCKWWARKEVTLPEQEAGPAAELGTAMHAVAEGADLDTVAASGNVDADELRELVEVYREWWPRYSFGKHWLKELPFAFDVLTGRARLLGGGGQGSYPEALEHEIPGTTDACTLDEVLDLKSGRPPKTLVEYRRQVEHAAVCLSLITGVSEVKITIAHVTPDGVFTDSAVMDALELAEAADTMRAEFAEIATSVPRNGSWCKEKWCPAMAVCPETQAPLALVPELRRLPLLGDIDNDADASLLIDALPRFEAWVKERKAAVKKRALTNGGITLQDGRRYVIARSSRETLRLDVPGALEALRSVLPNAEAAIVMKTSKEAVKRAAKLAGLPQSPTEREVVNALRTIGAVKLSEWDEVEIQQPALPVTGTEN